MLRHSCPARTNVRPSSLRCDDLKELPSSIGRPPGPKVTAPSLTLHSSTSWIPWYGMDIATPQNDHPDRTQRPYEQNTSCNPYPLSLQPALPPIQRLQQATACVGIDEPPPHGTRPTTPPWKPIPPVACSPASPPSTINSQIHLSSGSYTRLPIPRSIEPCGSIPGHVIDRTSRRPSFLSCCLKGTQA